MKVEALEVIKSRGYILSEGDIITVPDDVGAHWCKHGWAKDTSGAVQTGERRVINAAVDVDNIVSTQNSSEA